MNFDFCPGSKYVNDLFIIIFNLFNGKVEFAFSLKRLLLTSISPLTFTSIVLYVAGEDETPDNPAVQKSLNAMLTSYITRKIQKEEPHEVRKIPSCM